MRVDNYVIAMINKGLLPIPQWAVKWIGGSQLLATNALEIAFRAAVLPILMHYAASCSATPGGSVTARRSLQMRQAASSIRARARLGALLCIVISPFVSLYLFVHTMVKYVAALSTQPAVVAARQWTPLARWRYREFNELPHEFRKRLNRAYEPAQRYCESFPVYWLAVPASFLSFVVSGFVFALVVLSLIDDNVMINADVALGRSGVWWLTVLGSALALLRSVAPDPNAVYSPDEHLAAVCKVTHYMPQRWRNRAGDAAVRREFARDYDYRFAVLVRELLSIAIAPVLLAWYVPRIAEPLVHFVDISTVNVAGVGSVCQLALFRLTAGGGDPLYGSPATGAAPEGGLRAQDGKLEKSLLLFRANHPQWRAPAESRGLVDNLRQFAERRLGTPARAVPSDGDEFDQLMQASAGLAAAPARPAASARRRGGAAALRATAELDDNVDPMEALTEVIEQYHAERAAAAGERNDAAIDDSADFDAGPVRPLDWQQPPV
jgi:autophagy-related protein 9